MISPPPPPRLTPRAWAAVHRFATAWVREGHGVSPALQVQAEVSEGAWEGEEEEGPRLHLQLVDLEKQGTDPYGTSSAGRADRVRDRPVPLRYEAATALVLRGRIIDFEEEGGEGGVRGFLVRTAGPSGSRVSSPPSPAPSSPAPSSPAPAERPPASAPAPSQGLSSAPTAAPTPYPASPPLVQLAPRRPRPAADTRTAAVLEEQIDDLPLEEAIRRTLEDRVNPLVESHGGVVRLEGVDEGGVARVSMAGGCQGCASAAGTLNQVVRRILLRAVPSLTEVVDVTVHAEGTNPWYRAAGRSPAAHEPATARQVPTAGRSPGHGCSGALPDPSALAPS